VKRAAKRAVQAPNPDRRPGSCGRVPITAGQRCAG
jgi:hypothetical protein